MLLVTYAFDRSPESITSTTLPRMAMGIRDGEQSPLWVVTADLPKSPGHPFYARLNALLEANDFDRFVEKQCQRFYAVVIGRPSLTPGRYFRLLLLRWKTVRGSKRAELQALFAANRRLFKAYVLREQLDRLWTYKTRTGV